MNGNGTVGAAQGARERWVRPTRGFARIEESGRERDMVARFIQGAVVTGLLVVGIGCSKQVTVLEADLTPGQNYDGVEIATRSGAYRFERVLVTPDSLVGEYHIEVQRQSARDGIYYEDVLRRRSVDRDDVVTLSAKKQDAERTLFFGAGVVAVGFLLANVFDQSLSVGGGGGAAIKPDPDRP